MAFVRFEMAQTGCDSADGNLSLATFTDINPPTCQDLLDATGLGPSPIGLMVWAEDARPGERLGVVGRGPCPRGFIEFTGRTVKTQSFWSLRDWQHNALWKVLGECYGTA